METAISNPYMRNRSKIGTAADHYAMRCGPGATRADFVWRAAFKLEMPWLVDMALGPLQGMVAVAEVNHNRWIAACGTCGGKEAVDPADPAFFCFSCFNIENGGHPRPVMFPDRDTIRKVEAQLLARPDVRTRNWAPHETADQLVAENLEHGLVEA